ncbi:ABC transporter substrate-binding protein [Streptosporangium sp. NBC_01755]|uniref:heme/hemin ABC transporter substrate-binding protein n=1 Tax=unclassified Streptosporangium TaxID=2632669 RepID=UPI002DDB84A6|nr:MULTISPECIES: ABC transporter substrate-binding protein [unclassified Streptosporangium]WSA24277.1 ABC transporter substrate-binding protein [Streptosporangium sp. NBC_01810]WSC97649.1 ABC transporter substrate-binding protein [Streptosporangium sp. NBC_01755]
MKRGLIALLAVGTVVLAGCGSTAETSAEAAPETSAPAASTAPAAQGLPVTVQSADGSSVEVKDASKIIPLTSDVAEIVFALGLADRVVGVDLSAMGLPEARQKPQIGYQRALAAEGILSLKPTVLLGTEEAGPPPVIEQLKGAGIPVVMVPSGAGGVDEVPAKIELIGKALGVPDKGAELAAKTKSEIDAARAKAAAAGTEKPRVAFLYLRGQSKTYQIGGTGTRADAMIAAAGAEDAGTGAGVQGYKPITAEAMVKAAPDHILVMKMGLESVGGVDGLLKLPGVAETPAGKNKRIVSLDDLELLGMGPRTGQAIGKLVTAFQAK